MTTVYTDGSWMPGVDGSGYSGIGIWFGNNDVRNTALPVISEHPTNQVAELIAIRYALRYCIKEPIVHIWSDSMYAINCATVWYKKWEQNGWLSSSKVPVKNKEIIREIVYFIRSRESRSFTTHFHHVRGHQGNEGNEGADVLARRGVQLSQNIVENNTKYLSDGPFSNHFKAKFTTIGYDGKVLEFTSVDHYYMHSKAILAHDYGIATAMMRNPDIINNLSIRSGFEGLDKRQWENIEERVVYHGNLCKFVQNDDLRSKLLDTGDAILAMLGDDTIWCTGTIAAPGRGRHEWKGGNLHGKILMKVRDEISSL